jgi:hypothetical protein
MRPHPAWGPLPTPAVQVPTVQGERSLPEPHPRLVGIEQVVVVTIRAPQVLAPQLQPQIAGESPRPIA